MSKIEQYNKIARIISPVKSKEVAIKKEEVSNDLLGQILDPDTQEDALIKVANMLEAKYYRYTNQNQFFEHHTEGFTEGDLMFIKNTSPFFQRQIPGHLARLVREIIYNGCEEQLLHYISPRGKDGVLKLMKGNKIITEQDSAIEYKDIANLRKSTIIPMEEPIVIRNMPGKKNSGLQITTRTKENGDKIETHHQDGELIEQRLLIDNEKLTTYKNSLPQVKTTYHLNGNPKEVVEYKDGRESQRTKYYDNKNKQAQIQYDEHGNPTTKTEYDNLEREIASVTYYNNKKPEERIELDADTGDIKKRIFYHEATGKPHREINYYEGSKEKDITIYNENGLPLEKTQYDLEHNKRFYITYHNHAIEHEVSEYNEEEVLLAKTINKETGKKYMFVTYHDNKNLAEKMIFYSDGVKIKQHTLFQAEGRPIKYDEISENKVVLIERKYHNSGNLAVEIIHRDDNTLESVTEYYDTIGKKMKQILYDLDGIVELSNKSYLENGNEQGQASFEHNTGYESEGDLFD